VPRLTACVLALLTLFAFDMHRAEACGEWSMRDVGRGNSIHYLINALAVHKLATDGGKGRRIGALYFDEDTKVGLRVVVKGKVVLDVKGDKLVRRGKQVGTITAATGDVTIGKQKFLIKLTPVAPLHSMPTWKLEVTQGDKVIIESDGAQALCRGAILAPGAAATPDATSEDEVRRRVVYYLAWRVLGAP
jgi:hypothetical protein